MNPKLTLIRIIITWTCVLFVFFIAHQVISSEIRRSVLEKIQIPRNGTVFVDQNSASGFSNGSPEHPFKTINESLDFILSHDDFSKILVHQGKYKEKLVLAENIQLAGIDDDVEIINPKVGSGNTIEIHGNCYLSNLKITGGKSGIYFPLNISGKVVLNQLKISQASQWGIFNERSPELSLKIIASEITKNARQGLYLKESTFYINNSKVHENGEEGIDLHVDMDSTIKKTEIFSNGEGGIETELGNIKLAVENCKIHENGASGINLQSFETNSNVLIKNNQISNNEDFGIRCAQHASFTSPYFSKAMAVTEDNEIYDNGDLPIDRNCRR